MTLESDLAADLILYEAERLFVYDDKTSKSIAPGILVKGQPTVGVGRNLAGRGITQAESRYLLANDIADVQREAVRQWPWYSGLPGAAKQALLHMLFEMGMPRLLGFHDMLAALSENRFTDASAEALDSDWARDDVSPERSAHVANLYNQAQQGPGGTS